MNHSKKYLITWLLSAVLFALALGAINYVIDPLRYYHLEPGTREMTGFEQSHKVWQVNMRQTQTMVLGNSRTLYGFDVKELGAKNAYNYSFPGPSIEEVEKQFENALYSTSVKNIYLVVDGICSSGTASSRNLSGLFSTDMEWLKAEFMRAKYLISLTTLKASIRAFSMPIFYDDFGRRISFVYGPQSGETISERVKIRESYSLERGKISSQCNTKVYERMLTKAYKSGISVTLMLNPTHVRLINIAANNNIPINSHLNMKKQIVMSNEKVAEQLGMASIPIYDFNLINQYTTEPFDLVNNIEPKYWYESSHYKKALGDKLISWINSPLTKRDTAIGVALTSQNIEHHIAQQLKHLKDWQIANPISAKDAMSLQTKSHGTQ